MEGKSEQDTLLCFLAVAIGKKAMRRMRQHKISLSVRLSSLPLRDTSNFYANELMRVDQGPTHSLPEILMEAPDFYALHHKLYFLYSCTEYQMIEEPFLSQHIIF